MSAFPEAGCFAGLYPEVPGLVRHTLAGHPMFELEALVALAATMRPETVEYNRGDLPIGIDPDAVPGNGLSVEATIRGIEHNGSWMVLKFVEQNAAYRALLEDTLADLGAVVGAATGAMHQLESFVFISSPGSVTPLHFDPEHNILLQLRGTKTMTVFPCDDEEIAPGQAHERFHRGQAHRNLVWQDGFSARGKPFVLEPGDGMHVPVMTPHFVANGPAVSISFSVTWRSDWSYRLADARAMNAALRRIGLRPQSPGRFPQQNRTKALAWRALRRLGA